MLINSIARGYTNPHKIALQPKSLSNLSFQSILSSFTYQKTDLTRAWHFLKEKTDGRCIIGNLGSLQG